MSHPFDVPQSLDEIQEAVTLEGARRAEASRAEHNGQSHKRNGCSQLPKSMIEIREEEYRERVRLFCAVCAMPSE